MFCSHLFLFLFPLLLSLFFLLHLLLLHHQRPFNIDRHMSNDEIASNIKHTRPSASVRWDHHTCDLLRMVRSSDDCQHVMQYVHTESQTSIHAHTCTYTIGVSILTVPRQKWEASGNLQEICIRHLAGVGLRWVWQWFRMELSNQLLVHANSSVLVQVHSATVYVYMS